VPTKLMKDLEYGKWYKYAHDELRHTSWTMKHDSLQWYDTHGIDQEHFPTELKDRKYL
jgi:replication-associated recombination protein RarA